MQGNETPNLVKEVTFAIIDYRFRDFRNTYNSTNLLLRYTLRAAHVSQNQGCGYINTYNQFRSLTNHGFITHIPSLGLPQSLPPEVNSLKNNLYTTQKL